MIFSAGVFTAVVDPGTTVWQLTSGITDIWNYYWNYWEHVSLCHESSLFRDSIKKKKQNKQGQQVVLKVNMKMKIRPLRHWLEIDGLARNKLHIQLFNAQVVQLSSVPGLKDPRRYWKMALLVGYTVASLYSLWDILVWFWERVVVRRGVKIC